MFKVEVIGNLGADAVVKSVSGSSFISFRIAHTSKYRGADEEQHERTQWIDVIISNPESPILPYLKEGTKVFVRGNGALRVYSSPKLRAMVAGLTINAVEIELCGGKVDAVPSRLVVPDTGVLVEVSKIYHVGLDTSNMGKNELKPLYDEKGRVYHCDKKGYVHPVDEDVNESE